MRKRLIIIPLLFALLCRLCFSFYADGQVFQSKIDSSVSQTHLLSVALGQIVSEENNAESFTESDSSELELTDQTFLKIYWYLFGGMSEALSGYSSHSLLTGHVAVFEYNCVWRI